MSSSRPITPSSGLYGNMPEPHQQDSLDARPQYSSSKPTSYLSSNVHAGSAGYDLAHGGPNQDSVLSQTPIHHENGFADPGQSADAPELNTADSVLSQSQAAAPSRQGTLKKKASLKRTGSMKRSLSRRSSAAGSVRSLQLGDKEKYEHEDNNSAFFCPVPTSGNPTELLSARFQAWRKILKDLINYFRDIQKSYETRSKSLLSASNVLNSATIPANFMSTGGIGDAMYILRDFQKQSLNEANKSRDVENEVIMQLTGLRSDLQQKIKEIKGLSGDFKNSVDKEQNNTRGAIKQLQDALGLVDRDAAATSGSKDPFLIKLGVDRQLGRQIEEENYLHRAYLNLESSGRELESIVVGEIQKAYNAYASILQREANEAFETAEKLKEGPLAMAKDHEWNHFVTHSDQMVDSRVPVRSIGNITYPGKDHPAAIDVKSGMLERKSKYLKNYTPGWYVLSPTHLHEFKSADRIASQAPVMSLYLPEQKLGSHSEPSSSSHKFMLKGSQTGSMHRGHAWVFRAESHDTMMAWFGDIKELTEKTGEERNAFVRRQHARSLSGNSMKPASIGSGNSIMQEDEADAVPYSTEASVRGQSIPREGAEGVVVGGLGAAAINDMDDTRSEAGWRPPQQRPSPGGHFPSDVNVNRGLQVAPMSPSSGESDLERTDREALAGAAALPGSDIPFSNSTQPHTDLQRETVGHEGAGAVAVPPASSNYTPGHHPHLFPGAAGHDGTTDSQYGDWMAPIAAGAGGAAIGAEAMHHHNKQTQQPEDSKPIPVIDDVNRQMDNSSAVPAHGTSSAPIPIDQDRSLSRPRGATESTQATTLMHGTSSSVGDTISTVPTSITGATEETEKPAYTSATGMFDTNGTYVGPRAANADMEDPTAFVVRPTLTEGSRAKSVQTISELHVPGEFPGSRANSDAGGIGAHALATQE